MKKATSVFLISIFLLINASSSNCQTIAVTETGDTIYVYDNGTWSYEFQEEMPLINELDYLSAELKIDTVEEKLIHPTDANKEVRNSKNQFIIKYNDRKWKRVPPATLNEIAEFAFEGKTFAIWCIVIAEETEIAPDLLFKIAKNTMEENTGSNVDIINTELRTVNGSNVIRGTFKAYISSITFVFDSYYFSNDLGSVQFTVWSGDKIWERNEKEILDLLNGLIVM